MNDLQKVEALVAVLQANGNKASAEQILTATGTPRRARRAVFMARKAGFKLEAVREPVAGVSARAVTGYVFVNTDLDVAAALEKIAPKRKPKAAAVAKPKKSMKQKVEPKKKAAKKSKVVEELVSVMTAADDEPLGEVAE